MNIDTANMKAADLAFAIAALERFADIKPLRNALIALIGEDDAYAAEQEAAQIIAAYQFQQERTDAD